MDYTPTPLELDEIKSILGIKGTDDDEYLNVMVPILVEHASAHCNNLFIDSVTGLVKPPGGVRLFVAKACEHNMKEAGLKSRSMGSVSYSYDLEFPESLSKYLRPYKRLRFHATR